MSAVTLTSLDQASPPPPASQPTSPAVLLEAAGQPGAKPTPAARLAYLFRRCPGHPLRQILADHRGVDE